MGTVDETERESYTQSNDSHASFTTTLEHTLNLLRPYIPNPRARQPDCELGPAAPLEEVTNRFSKLELKELVDQNFEEPTEAAMQKPAALSRVKYVVDNSEEERWTAMNFLLYDYAHIRSIIHITWHSYLIDKTLNLITAAAFTQAAMQIIRDLVHNFAILFPHISSMEVFYLEYLRQSKHIIHTEPEGKQTATNPEYLWPASAVW
jgi:hypothetical protein